MATHLREDMAAQTAADICAAITSALDSDPITRPLAPLWDALAQKGDGLAAQRRARERTLGRARARLFVADARWDAETASFGRYVVNESEGRRDRPPYTRFFVGVTPSDAQAFGIDREVKQGRAWIEELGREPGSALAEKWTPRLTSATDTLEANSKEREAGMSALAMQGTSELLYIGEINVEIDKLEGALLQLFPGQPKRVASFLTATKPRRKRKDDDGEDEGSGGGEG
ncbi:hypothetical protein [Polyangium jinanense]|uniref:Uncharacterized protein n=1 Tax=Polyangium jinanense TaxID=2829994 RepID=A0A9X3X416_9BACT|nr:hypothetical protein [Polyangium jinanense]MDC3954668.1 hypothetical protein [Polyangium jinanense]MDC3980971.1 hypothetical protein [Polyangium jinanense]